MTGHFLREGGWDLFMQVFSEAHCVGHQCWHLHDASHPAHDARIAAALGDPVRRVYRAIDGAVGEILESAGDCMTFVFSSHGMSHWYGAQFLLSQILFRLGAARQRNEPVESSLSASLASAPARWAWHRLPPSLRHRLAGLRERFGPSVPDGPSRPPTIDADTSQSRCFTHLNGLAVGGIRLNLRGREPEGILNPGAEADEFCRTLADDLLDIVEDRSGLPLIRRVIRVMDHYNGPRLAELPDLLVEYNDAIPVGSQAVGRGRNATLRIRSPKIGMIKGTNAYGRTGEHRSQGFLVVAGPTVSPGTFSTPVSVLDLAPTWTRVLGIDFEQAEGSAIETLSPRLATHAPADAS
jgi:predicted AlkP superfamily phosphohydrolase/phosphomutase